MKLTRHLFLKSFLATLGLILIVAGCYLTFHFIYLSVWEVRGLVRSPYPFSAFSSPVALYGTLILLLAVVAGWGFTFGKRIWRAIKGKSDWSRIIIYTGISLFPMILLLMGIYYLYVRGYESYLHYRVVEVITSSEYQLSKAREIIIQIAKIDLYEGILYAIAGGVTWWSEYSFLKGRT